MTTARNYIEKTLFPGWSVGQRRRHVRFLGLGVLLGGFMSVAFGVILFLLNSQGRL